mmetsp:Transcript_14027/g.18281  ORF Transcript_14027/g.18281 Transcript_14027/m.18281 type:complete len:211 (+) Transcript_14027:126-758(+)|eukprot:CAMPEP_0198144644 /NCGR_PEP_ID=MMETSP1443-20131203/17384_1 /TAXON_ID=186043 /ORGANISM="Entomoneis sp., Strain CCMP2396" /LENGTH=210 /DNA_ID=CAMNT_0043808077 /DNA_START=59 /DNA_END=691 /DNA_ORIENTATION=+
MPGENDDGSASNESGNAIPDMSPLQAATNMADVIVKNYKETNPEAINGEKDAMSWKLAPGFMEGLVAATGALVFLAPIGRALQVRKSPAMLGMYTVTQITVSAYAAIYVGSLVGAHNWLKRMSTLLPTVPSPSADTICQDPRVIKSIQQLHSMDVIDGEPTWFSPDRMVLKEFQKSLMRCQQRNEYNEQQQQQSLASNQNQVETSKSWYG